MFTALFWLAAGLAVFDWAATASERRGARWVTKPGALIALIAWFTQVGGWQGVLVWFGLALIFSLLGDILLQAPKRYFLHGIGAFFFVPCFYIAGFNLLPIHLNWAAVLPVLAVAGAFTMLIRQVHAGMRAKEDTRLLIPVVAYAAVLSIMALSGIGTLFRPGWNLLPAALVAMGAVLFLISDAFIAYNRFVKPTTYQNLVVMITYHAAQFLITTGVLIQFST
jgi:uncharacterized membrane protein YhhN